MPHPNPVAVVTMVAAGLGVFHPATAAQHPDSLATAFTHLMDRATIPGLQAAWFDRDGVRWSGSFGVRRAGAADPVTSETVFEAASLSKPVVAYATLRLASRNALDLDAPLWDAEGYDRLEHDERARAITARMVLTHTTGLPNWGSTPLQFRGDPGGAWGYSGEGFVFLAAMLERQSGVTLNELVTREVFEPLGMRHSSFVWRDAYDATTATPHDLIGRPGTKRRPASGNAAASLHTTAHDYARFVRAVLDGTGLTPELASELREPLVPMSDRGPDSTRSHVAWGLGWGIQLGAGDPAIWHWGDNGDFRCFVIAYPDRREGFVYFTNSNNGLAIADDLVSLVFADEHWSIRWLDYWRWDTPQRLARIDLRRAFLEDDTATAWERYDHWNAQHPDVVGDVELRNLGMFLMGEQRFARSAAVHERRLRDAPSADAWTELGVARIGARDYERALEHFHRAIALDSSRASALEGRIAWAEEGLAAERRPPALVDADLHDLAGRYGARLITLIDGRLWYEREGVTKPTPLVPINGTTFTLETNGAFRLQFERDPDGAVMRVVGLYPDGRRDVSERSEGHGTG